MKQGLLGLNYFFKSQSFSRTLAKYMKISDAHFWFHQNPRFFSEMTNSSGSGKMNSNLDHAGSTGTLTICTNPLHLWTIRSKQAMWMLLLRHRLFIWWYLFELLVVFLFFLPTPPSRKVPTSPQGAHLWLTSIRKGSQS